MNKTLLVFGASNSRKSINKILAHWAAQQLQECDINLIDLNDYEMPIYSIDREMDTGIPKLAHDFRNQIKQSDGIIISFAEHNGAYTAAFKNIYDWVSRIHKDVWDQKPMFLLSTSPGGRGAKTVLGIASDRYKFSNKSPICVFSLPSFHQNFNADKGIIDQDLKSAFSLQLEKFEAALIPPN